MDVLAIRPVVAGGRELDRALAVLHVDDVLNAPLPVRPLAHNHRPTMILQRRRDNLAGRRTETVDQHRDREVPQRPLASSHRGPLDGVPPLGRDNLPFLNEQVGNLNSDIQQPAGIEPQVQHQPLQSLFMQLLDSFLQLAERVPAEAGQPDVANLLRLVQPEVPAAIGLVGVSQDCRDLNHRAGNGQLLDLVGSHPLQREVHLFAGRTPHFLHGVGHLHLLDRLAVDFENHITRANARLEGGSPGERRGDHQFPLGATGRDEPDLDADAAKFLLDLVAERAEIFGADVIRERVEFLHHPLDRRLNQPASINLLHVVLIDLLEGVGQHSHEFEVLFFGGTFDHLGGRGGVGGRGGLLGPGQRGEQTKLADHQPRQITPRHDHAPAVEEQTGQVLPAQGVRTGE